MRRPFTLIETLIAFAIGAGLISLLFGFLYQSARLNNPTPIIQEYVLYHRLSQVLTETTKIISTGPHNLIFFYNNGIDDDPKFSSTILAHLYLDDYRLILATWPHPDRWEERPHRAEILAREVDTLELAYFEPCEWQPNWEADDLPAIIQLSINDNTLKFPLHAADKPIRCVDASSIVNDMMCN